MGEQPPMILYHGRMTHLVVVSLGSTKPFIVIGKSLERATLKGWGKNVLFGNTTFKIFWTKLRLEKQIEKKTNYYIIITPKMVCPLHLSPLRILTFLHDISSSNLNYVAIMFGGKVLDVIVERVACNLPEEEGLHPTGTGLPLVCRERGDTRK